MPEDTQSKSREDSLYTHPDCELIQSEALAKQIRSRLKELYQTGTRSATATWRGAEKLDLLQTAEIKGRYGDGEAYMITQIKNTVDGGFKQEIKGVSLPPIQKQSINGVDITGGT